MARESHPRRPKPRRRRPLSTKKQRLGTQSQSLSTPNKAKKIGMPKRLRDKLRNPDLAKEILFDNQPQPDDYGFVPKGDVFITRNCRSKTLDLGKPVYTVYSTSTYLQTGIYVPSHVYTAVKQAACATSDARQQAVAQKDARDLRKARLLLEKEFPCMPEPDINAVLNHAFLKGSGRVGRSGTVGSDENKVRLAVEAHIRHVHTDYDRLIKLGLSREEAREDIWEDVKKIKKSWGKESLSPTPAIDDMIL
ncbi:hypothetical protein FQN57_000176 [Myotisia sp. PD_48]|nr:hypothetical protein FQN57_000176 [Myotisia sp. PD_48]